jgi:hypothetical protein
VSSSGEPSGTSECSDTSARKRPLKVSSAYGCEKSSVTSFSYANRSKSREMSSETWSTRITFGYPTAAHVC